MYKHDSALNNLQELTCHKIQPTILKQSAAKLSQGYHFVFQHDDLKHVLLLVMDYEGQSESY